MDIITELFEIIEDDIEFNLAMYKNLISQGKLYALEKKVVESKNSLMEIIVDEERWIREVNKFIILIQKEGYTPVELRELYNRLKNVYKEGMNKVKKYGKSEIESISIGGNNFIINNILNEISTFIKKVNENYIPTIENFQNDVVDYRNKGHTDEIWLNIYNTLEEYKDSLWTAEDKCSTMYRNYMNNFKEE